LEDGDRITNNVMPKWKKDSTKLQSRRQKIEIKIGSLRRKLLPPSEDASSDDGLSEDGA